MFRAMKAIEDVEMPLQITIGTVLIMVAMVTAVTGFAPVLVDFGLAGRHLRPGCGTANYGAPEIWSPGEASQAIPADVYAFGCLIFEAYTGKTLFDGAAEDSMIMQHMAHDGDPELVRALIQHAATKELGTLVARCIRQDPASRITMRQARQLLASLTLGSEHRRWPLRIAS